MNRRDAAVAKSAVEVLLMPGAGAELRRCASAALASLGVDEHTAMAEARERPALRGKPGPLRKDVGNGGVPGAVTVRAPMSKGGAIELEMTPAEAVSLASAVHDALAGRGVRWT